MGLGRRAVGEEERQTYRERQREGETLREMDRVGDGDRE